MIGDNKMGTLLNENTGTFAWGKHEGKTLEEVADSDIEYLVFLVEESETDTDTKIAIEVFLEDHPDYLAGMEV